MTRFYSVNIIAESFVYSKLYGKSGITAIENGHTANGFLDL